MSAKLATELATATMVATNKITASVMTVGSLVARLASEPAVRGGSGGPMGGVSPGAGAQGTNDGPLGVGPIPVLSEPLGSSISDHRSAGLARCRDRACCQLSTGTPLGHCAVHRFVAGRHIRLFIRNLTA